MMLTLRKYLQEESDHTLYVFDIDDTLFRTYAKIHVLDANGKIVRSLDNQEYNSYKVLPGQTLKFDEFRDSEKFDMTSRPITKMLDKVKFLQKQIEGTSSKIIFVTAREDFDDKEKFLNAFRKRKIDIDKIHVYRTGNDHGPESKGEKKAKVIRKYLQSGDFTKAEMYDDHLENLEAFKDLQREFPDVSFEAYQVFHDGSTRNI
jgi:predicted ribosome quality control (RQC) complex YloA/Tae2 family protein